MKWTILALSGSLLIAIVAPAYADHGSGNVYYIDNDTGELKWSNTATEAVCMSEDFWEHLSLNTANNAAQAAATALTRWTQETDINVNFNVNGFPGCGDFNWNARYNNGGQTQQGFCDLTGGSSPSSSQYDDLTGSLANVDAAIVTCDLNDNGIKDYFSAVINKAQVCCGDAHWNFAEGSFPESDEIDVPALMMHEGGHAMGQDVHWPGTGADPETWCDDFQSLWNTMCGTSNGWFGVPWGRTLESHDVGEANQIY